MKKCMRRVFSLLLAGVMATGLCACGGDKEEEAAKKEAAKQNVYRMEDVKIDILEQDESMDGLFYQNDKIYILGVQSFWEEYTGTRVSLLSANTDGGDAKRVELFSNVREIPDYEPYEGGEEDNIAVPLATTEALSSAIAVTVDKQPVENTTGEEEELNADTQVYTDTYISRYAITADGVLLILESSSYCYDEMGYYQDMGYSMELYSYDFEGNQKFCTVLNDNQDEYVWYNAMVADKDGRIALITEEEITILNSAGEVASKVEVTMDGYVANAIAGRDGKAWLISYNDDWTKMYLTKFDLGTEKFEEKIELLGNVNNYGFSGGEAYDFLLTNAQGVYGYNIGDTEITTLVNYINSDINSNNINQILEAGEGRMVCSYYDEVSYDTLVATMYAVAPEDVLDREIINLGCNYLDYWLRQHIIAYNKENTQYRIMVTDYSTYNTMDDYSVGETKLNNDILAGNTPDIMVFSGSSTQMNNFISKGILADIGKMIEEDESMNMDDYMTNVFDAYSVDGKLYSVIPCFDIQTVVGKTAMVGDTPGWMLADLQALMDENPEATAFGDGMTRSDILSNLLTYSGSRFVDSKTGKCYFDSEEFINALEFAAQFPETFSWEDVGDDYWMSSESQYRDGRTLLMHTSIYDFREYNRIAKGYFGENITPIGFPAEEGNGSVITARTHYAISATSKNKEGAWDFLKYFLSEEYQSSDRVSYTLPVLKSEMEKRLEAVQERPYWEYDDGTKEYYDDTWWINSEKIIIEPMTKEEADNLYDFICSVNQAYSYDEDLWNIVTEEVAPYFEGQKTAKEVATIIQSRAQIYINENR